MVGAVVIVKIKKRTVFHSRLQKFSTEEERDSFINSLKTLLIDKGYNPKDIKSYLVSDDFEEPIEKPKKGKRYCPYCGQVIKLKQGEFGSKVCPICGISEQDFYFKKYNK